MGDWYQHGTGKTPGMDNANIMSFFPVERFSEMTDEKKKSSRAATPPPKDRGCLFFGGSRILVPKGSQFS